MACKWKVLEGSERMRTRIALCLLVALAVELEAKDAMKIIAKGFLQALEECKKELHLEDRLLGDLYYFWKLDYSRLSRDTGCAIICMSRRLDLLDEAGRMHHGNAKEFAMQHGADAELAVKLVSIIHECEKRQDPNEDHCLWVLEVAKCFRTDMHDLDWNPDMETTLGEVLTEI